MNRKIRTLALASLVMGALAATSPLYAHAKTKPSAGESSMMGGGKMGGGDMMGMMEQMTTMMGLCNKMMEMAMNNMGGSGMQMPMDGGKAPEKKN